MLAAPNNKEEPGPYSRRQRLINWANLIFILFTILGAISFYAIADALAN
jgi:hypothetical protein